jgi:uncharacterized membrane protein
MRKLCLSASFLLIFHSALAHADDKPLPQPIVFVTNFLQLSDVQTSALITMVQARDAALQPIAEKLRANQEALANLLDASSPDAAAVGRLLIEIRGEEKQVGEVARQAAASFEETLLPEQLHRLQFVRQAAQVQPAIPAFKTVGLL